MNDYSYVEVRKGSKVMTPEGPTFNAEQKIGPEHNHWTWMRRHQQELYFLLVIVVVEVGTEGFLRWMLDYGGEMHTWDFPGKELHALYCTLQLFVLKNPLHFEHQVNGELEFARFAAPLLLAAGGIMAVLSFLEDQVDAFRAALAENHIVVCGLGEMGDLYARNAKKSGTKVVAIEKDNHNGNIARCRREGVIVLIGDATDPDTLRRASVTKSKQVIALCSDPHNAEITVRGARMVRESPRQRKRPRKGSQRYPRFLAHITSPELCKSLREWEPMPLNESAPLREFRSLYEAGARMMWEEHPAFGPGVNGDIRNVHLAVVGCSDFAASLIVHAAEQWRLQRTETCLCLPVTVVGAHAEQWVEDLCDRYPFLDECIICIPYDHPISSVKFETEAFCTTTMCVPAISSVYVCLDDASEALLAALRVQRRLRLERSRAPIHVRMKTLHGFSHLVKGAENGEESAIGSPISGFGLLEACCRPEVIDSTDYVNVELLAKGFHQQYIENANAGKTHGSPEAMVPWGKLPENLKESNRRQARGIRNKLVSIGCDLQPLQPGQEPSLVFTPTEIDTMAKIEHNGWMSEKTLQGYVYGPERDDHCDPPTHPSLLPYEQLPDEEQEKDRLACRDIPELLACVGYQVIRMGGLN